MEICAVLEKVFAIYKIKNMYAKFSLKNTSCNLRMKKNPI